MEFVKKSWDFIINNPKAQLIPLAIILALAGVFYFHNLGTDYITLWDEAVHVNVVKNLANDCCAPRLHLTDFGTDFQDWTNNYVWLHKPLMPLFLQAAVYKIFESSSNFDPSTGPGIKIFDYSLFAFRLPGALFALMLIIALFFSVRRHFGYITALVSASLLAFNPYMFALVKGGQFSGLHDLMFGFFGVLALDRILRIIGGASKILKCEAQLLPERSEAESKANCEIFDPSAPVVQPINRQTTGQAGLGIKNSWFSNMGLKRNYLFFGLFAGLAYLSKGGLALLFFPALFVASCFAESHTAPSRPFDAKRAGRASPYQVRGRLYFRRGETFLNFLYAILIALVVIFPEKIVLLILYPAEYYFEQNTQTLHLFKGLEYWGRPWDYYVTVYFRDLVLPYLYLPAIAAIIFGLWRGIKNFSSVLYLNTVQYLSKGQMNILIVWILSFLVLLSFGLTKISNFIFAALPAMLILLVLMFKWFWDQKHHAVIFALSATAVLSYIVIRLDLWRVKYHWFQDQVVFQRFAILLYEVLAFLAILIIYKIVEIYPQKFLPERAKRVEGQSLNRDQFLTLRPFDKLMVAVVSVVEPQAQGSKIAILAKCLTVASLFLILGTNLRANQLSDLKMRAGYEAQVKIKQAALEAQARHSKDSIFLLNYPQLLKSHLYFQYWSGREALEIYERQPIFVLKKILPAHRPVFVLSVEPIKQPDLKFIERQGFGYVYKLKL